MTNRIPYFTCGYLAGLLCLLLAVCCAGGEAADAARPLTFPPERGEVLVLPVRALDGDTIEFYYLVQSRGRLMGINAPEIHSKDEDEKTRGLAARDFLAKRLPKGPCRATLQGREKFGRLLLSIGDEQGNDLSELLVKEGHAKRWNGIGVRPK